MDNYRNKISKLKDDQAKVSKEIFQTNAKIIDAQSYINRTERTINKNTIKSMITSKLRQIETKQKEIVRYQKKVADLETKQSKILKDINSNLKQLESKEKTIQHQKDNEDKKRRDQELRHEREITSEKIKQTQIARELQNSNFVIDINKLPEKIKVVFFAANPIDQNQLRLDEEIREIKEKIRKSEFRNSIEFIPWLAVQTPDLLQALNEHSPHVVHFSGHGSSNNEIVFQDQNGNAKTVTKEAIVQMMNTMSDNIQLVIFNTCFSSEQAESIVKYVNSSIGMNLSINDEAAKIFSASFYSAIGFGKSVQNAFDQAKTQLMLEGVSEENIPKLYVKEGIDPEELILVKP